MVHRLTDRERRLLAAAAEFVLAGEWPWEDANEEAERAALETARTKLRQSIRRGKGEPGC
jgi:hypothetical protein